jgi:hypothetical protein
MRLKSTREAVAGQTSHFDTCSRVSLLCNWVLQFRRLANVEKMGR